MKVDWTKEKENLEQMIKNGVPYEKIGRIYNVSGNGIKKAAKRLNIELPVKRIISNREHFNKGVNFKKRSGYNECPICGNLKYKTSKLCSKCRNIEKKEIINNKTLGYYTEGKQYLTTKCNDIRKAARKILEESSVEKVCAYCHNHEYDQILEVHHIKGILEFDKMCTIGEINAIENLVWLCPNHHRMLELGLIKL